MRDAQPKTIYLKDYRVSDFLINKTQLDFELFEDYALVHADLHMQRNPLSQNQQASLVLDGINLELISVEINQVTLDASSYEVGEETLTVHEVSDEFVFSTTCKIYPQKNTALEGLYKSRTMFCTQCEAEGFRKITYYLDRPDVLSVFTTSLSADVTRYPVLLSNGDEVGRETLDDNRMKVTWHDPFKKPCYLFALVAGDLSVVEDSYETMSGKKVDLKIFVEEKDVDKCGHAMLSLKSAMCWDEDVYGREYDLNVYMIVAVDDFNMGAMENKGLNIFNTSCVLADPETTTDGGFQRVEAVVAHEYFHNWSGNRVTCRDWFQLSLKEGFTVYRDAEFSSDMNSRGVKRIEDVNVLRTYQFQEDAGPMAHPIQPASFMEISNFYTVTVYEKGSEVVRMLARMLGKKTFRKATDLYFDRFDGQAVTCDDFVDVMEEVSEKDLSQFKNWYSQAGTPEVHAVGEYVADKHRYVLTLKQTCAATPETPEGEEKQAFVIPVKLGFVSDLGDSESTFQGKTKKTHTLIFDQAEQVFEFEDVDQGMLPSLLRGFSAPVNLRMGYSSDDLVHLLKFDSDPFARWDAGQRLALNNIKALVSNIQNNEALQVHEGLLSAYRYLFDNPCSDAALMAEMFALPNEMYLAEQYEEIDVLAIHQAREFLANAMANEFDWLTLYNQQFEILNNEDYRPNAEQIAYRRLKNTALAYAMRQGSAESIEVCQRQYFDANNMTDRSAALSAMVKTPSAEAQASAETLLADFYERFKHEALVVNIWLQVQAANPAANALDKVKALMQHDAFDANNPNKLRSVIAVFARANAVNFHRADGAGYQFLADQIITLDKSNPQIASRLVAPLSQWRRYTPNSKIQMQEALERIKQNTVSKDVQEQVIKSLN